MEKFTKNVPMHSPKNLSEISMKLIFEEMRETKRSSKK